MLNTTIRMDADANSKDPDTFSYQLATSHQQLWSKPLPNGEFFQLHPLSQNFIVFFIHHYNV